MLKNEIEAGARTVLQIAEHYAQLKLRASELATASEASRRGYFTPSEDEEVKHLLVSYWQSRNALIELVISHQPQLDCESAFPHESFLIAYAGALVLVDAARFLRDQFHGNSLVRAKLNEPDHYFGIGPGTYELIQKSLTSPTHAWKLFHAAKYLQTHLDELRERVERPLMPLFELIQKLQHRLDVTLDRYSLARARVRARELQNRFGHGLFKQALYGLQKSVASFTANLFVRLDHVPKLRMDVAQQLRASLKPGDVLITRKEFAVTNYFLPGYWPHAALYLGSAEELQALGIAEHENLRPRWQRLLDCDPGESLRVLEALKDGVHIRSLRSPFGVDAIAVLRPKLESTQIAAALSRGFVHEGKSYDFDFDFNRSDRLVCTEVVYRSYERVGGVEFRLTRRAGRWTLAAEDIMQMAINHQHFVPHAVFSPAHAPHLAMGNDAERLLRTTLKLAT